ncbi:hypothetical protein B0J11DRAFT_108947 [Dendryphion nanum]|uniref:Zn(2)-C6 fungal-type domain-containing protein n=1 Tax=Dendryphion nanum TaxID=256645 RepID=A0A9P9DB12_9PLEO|nr:hypothetical protein B0J11DRAFT_108947 [Dendryphion nanum]
MASPWPFGDSMEDDAVSGNHAYDEMVQPVMEDAAQHTNNRGMSKGFSDDGTDSAWDRSYGHVQHQRNLNPEQQPVSPEQSTHHEEGQGTAGVKRLHSSLFGGPSFDMDRDKVVAEDQIVTKKLATVRSGPFGQSDSDSEDGEDGEATMDAPSGVLHELISSIQSMPNDIQDISRQPDPSENTIQRGICFSDVDMSDRDTPARFGESELNSYELRENVNRNVSSTWVDFDQSGNYDPEQEKRDARLKKLKAKGARKKALKAKDPKERTSKFIVRLRFPTHMGTIQNITDGEDYWPDGWSEVDSEDERLNRARAAVFRGKDPAFDQQIPIFDPGMRYEDLTGHPTARGCVECRRNSEECSMVNGGTWPCQKCRDDSTHCELIVPPVVKSRCRRCIEEGKDFCSFEDSNAGHTLFCEQCISQGYTDCFSHPPQGYKHPRIDLDEIEYGPNRQFVDCNHCRDNNKRCSIKKMSDRGPCSQCKKLKIGCSFHKAPPTPVKLHTKSGKKRATEPGPEGESSNTGTALGNEAPDSPYFTAADLAGLDDSDHYSESEREATPEFELEDVQGRKGRCTSIWTSFAHPITFEIATQDLSSCNFCELPIFGMVGHFEAKVHVIRWDNGLGYSELANGHRETYNATSMCQACVVKRLQTTCCPGHYIDRIWEEDRQDFEAAADELICADPRSEEMHYQQQRWCSFCFSLATHGCVTPQPRLSGDIPDDMVDGCGLRLCDRCEINLREAFGNDFNAMAEAMDAEEKPRAESGTLGGKVRADVGFLRTSGLMMKHANMAGDQ